MAVEVATVTGHYELFEAIRTFLKSVPVGWTEVEYDDSTTERLCWFRLPASPAQAGVHVGMLTYQDISADYYNITFFGAIGHVPGNVYTSQPGFSGRKTICCWDQGIKYWMRASNYSMAIGVKIQNIYEIAYTGKALIYATPGQFPYPAFVGGSLSDIPATRYSDTARNSFFKNGGSPCVLRTVDGAWINPEIWPFTAKTLEYDPTAGPRVLRNTAATSETAQGTYELLPLILTDASNVYGQLEGLYAISGFNNATENTLEIDGVTYVVLRNIWRTGFEDYIAMRML